MAEEKNNCFGYSQVPHFPASLCADKVGSKAHIKESNQWPS